MRLSVAVLGCLACAAAAATTQVCGEASYADNNTAFNYNADAWNPNDSGYQCLTVNNTTSSSPSFDATWKWVTDPNNVHAYPHVSFLNQALPARLANITELRLAVSWGMSALVTDSRASPANPGLKTASLAQDAVMANVAYDIFVDRDSDLSTLASTAGYEIMIWLGTIGNPYPVGAYNGKLCGTQQLGSVDFSLYSGNNSRGLKVFTWVSSVNQTNFNEDVSPLLQFLWRNSLVTPDGTLGLIEFGSETYHATNDTIFSASAYSMEIHVGTPPQFQLNQYSGQCSSMASQQTPSHSAVLSTLLLLSLVILWAHVV